MMSLNQDTGAERCESACGENLEPDTDFNIWRILTPKFPDNMTKVGTISWLARVEDRLMPHQGDIKRRYQRKSAIFCLKLLNSPYFLIGPGIS